MAKRTAPATLAARLKGITGIGAGRSLKWVVGVACFALLAALLAGIAHQVLVPPPAQPLTIIQDIPLPSGYIPLSGSIGSSAAEKRNPLAAGVYHQFDHFDFEALDPNTHLLFIAHTGITDVKIQTAHIKVDPKANGHVIVFDTQRDKVVARINIPHIAGIAVAPNLHKVYAADADDNIVYAIDESTLKPVTEASAVKAIALGDSNSPDAVEYDPVDHRIFVSVPGSPPNPDTANIDPRNQNVVAIDPRTDTVIGTLNMGRLPVLPAEQAGLAQQQIGIRGPTHAPQFGYDIGHVSYDAANHRLYVVTQILPDQDAANPITPLGSGELDAIDPGTLKVVQRVVLPNSCATPHGMTVDAQQQVAFIACVDLDSTGTPWPTRFQNLVRVDLTSMHVIPADPAQMRLAATPDRVVLDANAHVVFVACKYGVSVFDERAGQFHKVGDYLLGKNPHFLIVDEATQLVYLPVEEAGGRPVLRILRYNPSGG